MEALIGLAVLAIFVAAGVCLGLFVFAHLGLVLGVGITLAVAYGAYIAIAAVALFAAAIMFGLLRALVRWLSSFATMRAIGTTLCAETTINWIFGIVAGIIAFGAMLAIFSQSFGGGF